MLTIKSIRNYYPHLVAIAILLACVISLQVYGIHASASVAVEDQSITAHPSAHIELNKDSVYREYSNPVQDYNLQSNYSYDDEMLENLKDYQLEVVGKGAGVLVYNGDEFIGYIPLDYKCNLTTLLEKDMLAKD